MAEQNSLSLVDQSTVDLLKQYAELNVSWIEELDDIPTPLNFMRFVSKNRPFVVRGALSNWPATRKWNPEYLSNTMDCAAHDSPDGKTYFAKPLQENESFKNFFSYVRHQEEGLSQNAEVKYSQAHVITNADWIQKENDNLRGEYSRLYPDVAADIPWATECFGHGPDAVNLWIGNSRSVTALHRDNYENLYCQIIGQKHFVLLPAIGAACVNLQYLPSATYKRPNMNQELVLVPDKPETGDIPWALWDPDRPNENSTPFSPLTTLLRINLGPGDLLYIPALWYHKVSQHCLKEAVSISVNYWYDMSFEGSFFTTASFINDLAAIVNYKERDT